MGTFQKAYSNTKTVFNEICNEYNISKSQAYRKFKKTYLVYDINDEYVGEYDTTKCICDMLNVTRNSVTRAICKNSRLRRKYYVYTGYRERESD